MPAKIAEFKGRPIIQLYEKDGDVRSFAFGRVKARLIVKHFEEIKKFAEANE